MTSYFFCSRSITSRSIFLLRSEHNTSFVRRNNNCGLVTHHRRHQLLSTSTNQQPKSKAVESTTYHAPPYHQHRRVKHPGSESAAAKRRKAIEKFGAPKSISAIRDQGMPSPGEAAFIRPVGCTRRVFVLQPHFTSIELEGLAYRIRSLSKNDSINSILIATDNRDDMASGALPSLLIDRDLSRRNYDDDDHDDNFFQIMDMGFAPAPGKTYHVSSGYDPIQLYESGDYVDSEKVSYLLTNLSKLSLAIRGDKMKTKIPVITVPHGAIRDGGFALCTGSYVLATPESCFRIVNPSRGLSFDPVGLSYILPRLGKEFKQPSRNYPGCGMILGLTGYEADARDMVETGLATHYIDTSRVLGLLEQTLAELKPWNQQGIVTNPIRSYSEPEPKNDINGEFRNAGIAETVHLLSAFPANADADFFSLSENDYHVIGDDPSLEPNPMPWLEKRHSDLVNYAGTFDEVFQNENTVIGILERFREIAGRKTTNPEEQEGIDVAADIVSRLEKQSPLAISVIYKLMKMGGEDLETIESCIEREKKVQMKLFGREDFINWAKYTTSSPTSSTSPFTGWQHKSVVDVSNDEVMELVAS